MTEITVSNIYSAGGIQEHLSCFYDEAIQRAHVMSGVSVSKLHNFVVQRLITPSRTRAIIAQSEARSDGITQRALDALQSVRLIRAEVRGGTHFLRARERSPDRGREASSAITGFASQLLIAPGTFVVAAGWIPYRRIRSQITEPQRGGVLLAYSFQCICR